MATTSTPTTTYITIPTIITISTTLYLVAFPGRFTLKAYTLAQAEALLLEYAA